jgi:hypothetical protein
MTVRANAPIDLAIDLRIVPQKKPWKLS